MFEAALFIYHLSFHLPIYSFIFWYQDTYLLITTVNKEKEKEEDGTQMSKNTNG